MRKEPQRPLPILELLNVDRVHGSRIREERHPESLGEKSGSGLGGIGQYAIHQVIFGKLMRQIPRLYTYRRRGRVNKHYNRQTCVRNMQQEARKAENSSTVGYLLKSVKILQEKATSVSSLIRNACCVFGRNHRSHHLGEGCVVYQLSSK